MSKSNANAVALMPEPEIMAEPETVETGLNLSAEGEKRRATKDAIAAAIALTHEVEAKAETVTKDEAGQVEAAANDLMRLAARGLILGHIIKDELSAMLGASYGFKVIEKTGQPSKTPDGKGNSHRKRIVLLADAGRIAANPDLPQADWPKALQGCDAGEIADIAKQCLESEEITPSSAYNKLTKLKPKAPAKPLWQDAEKLGKLIAALRDDVTVNTIRQNEGLREAFAYIRDLAIAAELGECRALKVDG